MAEKKLERFKGFLVIDRDDLSECLIQQPQISYEVSVEHAAARARLDAIKLDLEELQADVDKSIRAKAAESGDKVTEAAIQNQIKLDKNVKEMVRAHLDAREEAEQWQALRDAFSQRSFMLRELVALHVSERHDVDRALGSGQRRSPVDEMAENTVRETAPARQRFRVRGKK